MSTASLLDALVELWHICRWHILLSAVAVPLAAAVYRSRYRKPPRQDAKATEDTKAESLGDLRFIASPETNVDAEDLSTTRPHAPPRRQSAGPKRILGQKTTRRTPSKTSIPSHVSDIKPLIFFSSLGGTTEHIARNLVKDLTTSSVTTSALEPQLLDLATADYDDYFTSTPKPPTPDQHVSYFYIILVPTYNIDTILDNFLEHLRDVHHDFRIDTAPLQSITGYAVFGFGDKEGWPREEEGFCSQAREVDKWMAKLSGGKRAYPVGMGDVKSDADARLRHWRIGVQLVLSDLASGSSLGEGVRGSGDAIESDEEEEADADEPSLKTASQRKRTTDTAAVADLESIGLTLPRQPSSSLPLPIDFTTTSAKNPQTLASSPPEPKEMVPINSPTHTSLTKQGYSIIGSHSGVKICRWTKSALRGRGSCYKYSFYGIASHLCMETTPSLSCSNKCVFCWRHGTNPVGTTWRWKVDPPDLVFEGVKREHYKKIRMMRGVPGVRAERFEEAMRIRHCALSLVGEPIFYPHINEFVGMLHAERISSFLVCNAQHPDQLAALRRVTQLYVSIDASNRDSLRKIDRPLHRDFWERFCRCLDILREKRFVQRTVFRLTLVKGFNIEDEAEGYAELVQKGLPCFIEVKGVTYCGTSTSKGAGLSMQNVPFYEEVCAFVVALNDALGRRGLDYGIAAEHAHSCCILLASERFKVDGRWNTTIDYARFFELLEGGGEFRTEDYMAATQEWALWGNGGFDPRDERIKRKGKDKGMVLQASPAAREVEEVA